MTEDDFRHQAALNFAETLEIAQAMKKFQMNIRQIPFEYLDQETWSDIQEVGETVMNLCDFVVESVIAGTKVLGSDQVVEAILDLRDNQ